MDNALSPGFRGKLGCLTHQNVCYLLMQTDPLSLTIRSVPLPASCSVALPVSHEHLEKDPAFRSFGTQRRSLFDGNKSKTRRRSAAKEVGRQIKRAIRFGVSGPGMAPSRLGHLFRRVRWRIFLGATSKLARPMTHWQNCLPRTFAQVLP